MSACRVDEPLVPLPLKRKGRPPLAPEGVQEVTLRLPIRIFDLCCREAHSRSVPLSVVLREAVIYSRHRRGELA